MATAPTTSAARADAAQLLYERYYANVYRYALSQLTSPQDAEDAAQNTFMRAFAALQKGVRPENEVAWLFKITHNVCASSKLAWLRRRRVESRRDELTGLQEALAAMPPRLREAFLLREWQGLSYAEIAERLDTSRSAVETLIFRARKHLAQSLEQPTRRVREALGIAPLLNFARGLFDATPVAVKAAGAVVVLAGAGAAVQPLVTQKHSTPPAPAVSLPIAPAVVQPADAAATPARQQKQHVRTAVRTSPAATTVARTPRIPLAPGAPPIQAPEPTRAPPTETPPHTSTPAAPSSGKAVPSVTVPLVQTPPVPSVTTPVLPVTTPALPPTPPPEIPAVPTANLPDLPTVPSVTLPGSLP